MGDTRIIVGKATTKANNQAFSQTNRMPFISPTLKTLITKDIMQDMSNDMKNEKTIF